MERKRFPQYLSTPLQVLWFESDDLVIGLIFYVLALLYGGLFWLLIIAGPYAYSSVKRKYPRGFLKHSLYFVGLVRLRGYPDFFETEFYE